MKFSYYYIVIMWVIVAVLIVADVKQLLKSKELAKQYSLNEYQVYDYSKKQKNMCLLLAIVAITVAIMEVTTAKNYDLSGLGINIALIVIALVEYITSANCMKFYYDDKHVIFEGDQIRYKSIKSIEKSGKRGKNYTMITYDGHSYTMYEDCANLINGQLNAIKEEKKEKKKK